MQCILTRVPLFFVCCIGQCQCQYSVAFSIGCSVKTVDNCISLGLYSVYPGLASPTPSQVSKTSQEVVREIKLFLSGVVLSVGVDVCSSLLEFLTGPGPGH